MRISRIKLAGFKSFVDPTTIVLPKGASAIVGPNGCGKSNLVDAVNWVLGESSAKQLRGESMVDVIFNGSTSRKPVGKAVVEIVFDNSEGSLGGAYAAYPEISIKRQITRDGDSGYFLNGTRCRRKDIIHLFLGTGLGGAGYSIIAQGTISRIVESRPEELRAYIEEAAEISKYKERRRETESRLSHTRENLVRLEDIRVELGKQLTRLEKQARTAEIFRTLKDEERRQKAEYLALRLRGVTQAATARRVEAETRAVAVAEAAAALAACEEAGALKRLAWEAANGVLSGMQDTVYRLSADLTRGEQSRRHHEEKRETLTRDLAQAKARLAEEEALRVADAERYQVFATEADALVPQGEEGQAAEAALAAGLKETEEALRAWQGAWDAYNGRVAEFNRAEQAEKSRLEHLRQGRGDTERRVEGLRAEEGQLAAAAWEEQIQTIEAALRGEEDELGALEARHDAYHGQIRALRDQVHAGADALDATRRQRQGLEGRIAALTVLQEAALGLDRAARQGWIEGRGWGCLPRLGQEMEVADGWEKAVEAVLRVPLDTLLGADLRAATSLAGDLPDQAVYVISQDRPAIPAADLPPSCAADVLLLADKVTSGWPLHAVLHGIHAVETAADALALCGRLRADESVVSRDGFWCGPNWVRIPGSASVQADGFLSREKEIKALRADLAACEQELVERTVRLDAGRATLIQWEQEDRELRALLQGLNEGVGRRRVDLAAATARLTQVRERMTTIGAELQGIAAQSAAGDLELAALMERLAHFAGRLSELEAERAALGARREGLLTRQGLEREGMRRRSEENHTLALRLGALRSQLTALTAAESRHAQIVAQGQARAEELTAALDGLDQPLAALVAEVLRCAEAKQVADAQLTAVRAEREGLEQATRRLDAERLRDDQRLAGLRRDLESSRIELSSLAAREADLAEQLAETGLDLAELAARLPEVADEAAYRQGLVELEDRIARLGPVNLAAIEECAEHAERKGYLDRQYADLAQAVATLEGAIASIDKETRSRFEDTFLRINEKFEAMFPRLFGGGRAYLEMVGDDFLEAGVQVIARPPGKRNSTIHLLSGGEKALTALALVFAIFELNPAPFCLLDEVDAPLDDTNVVRLSDMLRTMAAGVQFLIISHNKITMEIADQLIGVTMREPGVSHLVAVNMEEAVQLVAVG